LQAVLARLDFQQTAPGPPARPRKKQNLRLLSDQQATHLETDELAHFCGIRKLNHWNWTGSPFVSFVQIYPGKYLYVAQIQL